MLTCRQALLGAFAAAVLFCAMPTRAQESTLCTAMVHNGSNPFVDGKVIISPVFPTSLTTDYEVQWNAFIEQQYGAFENRVAVCSDPGDSPAAAATGRENLIYKYSGGFPIIEPAWRPQGSGATSAATQAPDTRASGAYDGTGVLGGRAFCMLQETQDGQPRALFSLVFSPPELESDYDATMAHRFVRHAQELYGARPDAVATCHRTDSEARAHNDRNHEAEMRRIKGWTVVMTNWSE